jgi:ATP-dependent DNA helicase Rep
VVYVAGLEEGLLPHKNSEEANTVDEERRLAYVAITRAQRELTLSYCQGRIVRGKDSPRTPSRFLSEIPPELLDRRDQEASQGAKLDMIRSFREKMKQQNATE